MHELQERGGGVWEGCGLRFNDTCSPGLYEMDAQVLERILAAYRPSRPGLALQKLDPSILEDIFQHSGTTFSCQ